MMARNQGNGGLCKVGSEGNPIKWLGAAVRWLRPMAKEVIEEYFKCKG